MVKLQPGLGQIVADVLQKEYGFAQRTDEMGLLSFEFSEDELALVKQIIVEEPNQGDFVGLELLPNLEMFSVISYGATEFLNDREVRSIGEEDIASIEKCSSLKTLQIYNQANVESLDLSKLTNLTYLNIYNNGNIKEVTGMEKLDKLTDLTFYGNNKLFENPNFQEVIKNNPDLTELNIDVMLFPNAIGYDTQTGEYNKESLENLRELSQEGTVKWCEGLIDENPVRITTDQIISMHNKACTILDQFAPIGKGTNSRDTIIGIEKYLAENVEYDEDALEHNYINGTEVELSPDKQVRLSRGSKDGTNGAFNALMFNKAVCQGYSRAMKYMLSLRGINSHEVSCIAEKDKYGMGDGRLDNTDVSLYDSLDFSKAHSILCIDDYYDLYCDPTWDAGDYAYGIKDLNFTLKTKKEMQNDHMFSFNERGVKNNTYAVPRKFFEESLRKVETYRDLKTSTVNQTKSQIQEQVRGRIDIQKEGNDR